MRYPQEITLEVRNEEPDKKRRFTPRSLFKHPLSPGQARQRAALGNRAQIFPRLERAQHESVRTFCFFTSSKRRTTAHAANVA